MNTCSACASRQFSLSTPVSALHNMPSTTTMTTTEPVTIEDDKKGTFFSPLEHEKCFDKREMSGDSQRNTAT